jgi:hypothetical protein
LKRLLEERREEKREKERRGELSKDTSKLRLRQCEGNWRVTGRGNQFYQSSDSQTPKII